MTTSETSSSTPATARPVVTVDIFSDVVCPWCYIGKRRFEKGLELARADGDLGVDFAVTFKPYQLDPRAAPGVAGPVSEAYAKKFGGPEKAAEILDHLTKTAAGDGLEFRMDLAQRANTLLAHRLIWRAGLPDSPVTQDAMKERLLRAYFMEGVHIGNAQALADTVADLGLDPDETLAFLETDDGADDVSAELKHGYENGITAVPTFVFNDSWAVPGAQDPETFAKVLEKLANAALEAAAD
ncbi:DsbA family oxidoreductase [Ilumatobacter coccineus]|uniref:DSBA-like thioredoxin domain-containing protein n=1 Tax=Ilumatobacter coccineus (strain NBRC 103263 / KCTC 29153 / YM16-304) TaxID=1313172 RepID=A0A6C7E4B6_ILUCY|nr:DsbA family oxidoreductase [Ilumatobacter coccineus]BAN02714.1 hypothetical protein YM304_24000 [Ilumatobacter coccineus YM16-304]